MVTFKEDIHMENSNRNSDFHWESLYSVSNDQKYDIINRVHRLDGTEDEEVIEAFKKEWDEVQTEGDDPNLVNKFEKAIERFNEKKERVGASIEGKRALIAQANELKDSEEFFKTAEAFKKLQTDWRELGYSGKELNDPLWEEFSEVNDYFFNRRNEFFEQQNVDREKAKELKEALIERAEELKASTDWFKTSKLQREMMEEWKEAGFASREVENELWEKFNAARQVFYKAQEEFFKELREKEAVAKEKKEALIEETHALKESLDFESTRKRFDEMMEEWKEAGHSGRKFEEDLWAQFREGRDHFYGRLTESSSQTREDRRAEAFDKINELNDKIDSLEDLNAAIKAKLSQLENRPEDAQTIQEIEETNIYLDQNEQNIDSLLAELRNLEKELERL